MLDLIIILLFGALLHLLEPTLVGLARRRGSLIDKLAWWRTSFVPTRPRLSDQIRHLAELYRHELNELRDKLEHLVTQGVLALKAIESDSEKCEAYLTLAARDPLDAQLTWKGYELCFLSDKSPDLLEERLRNGLDVILSVVNKTRGMPTRCQRFVHIMERHLTVAHLSSGSSTIVARLGIDWTGQDGVKLEAARSQLLFSYANRFTHLSYLYPTLLAILDGAKLIEFGSQEQDESFCESQVSRYVLLLMLAAHLAGEASKTSSQDESNNDKIEHLLLSFLETFSLSEASPPVSEAVLSQIQVRPASCPTQSGELEIVRAPPKAGFHNDPLLVIEPLQIHGESECDPQVLRVARDGGRKLGRLFDELASCLTRAANKVQLADLIAQSGTTLTGGGEEGTNSLEKLAARRAAAGGLHGLDLPEPEPEAGTSGRGRGLGRPILIRLLILVALLMGRWLAFNYLQHVSKELKQEMRHDYIQLKRDLYGLGEEPPHQFDWGAQKELPGGSEPADPLPVEEQSPLEDMDGPQMTKAAAEAHIGQLMEALVEQVMASGNVNIEEMMRAFDELHEEGVDEQLQGEGLDLAHFRHLFQTLGSDGGAVQIDEHEDEDKERIEL